MRLLALALLLALGLASEGKRYLFVRYDPEKGVAFLSDGSPLPPGLQAVPGQYVEVKGGRLKPTRAWQPPQDLVKVFAPQNAARVVFSHERHFAALGAKGTTCQTCHALLDRDKAWKSLAPLELLASHPDRAFPREELLERVFPQAESEAVLRVYVRQLRRKLAPWVVARVPLGYKLGEP
ncbi:MAG: winged helix-turn-helix domain-containing protein [Thermus sp.]|uniref:winged helix-turn-helix domain-containing protein n=1 Tax=Thermus sp. TaxID=275 RepID=UPI003D0A8F51